MIILDIPRRTTTRAAHIPVPVYHLAHLSMDSAMDVHLCCLPGQGTGQAGAHNWGVPELVVCPFEFSKWDKMWRLNVTLRDGPGLVFDVADTLRKLGINILCAESSQIEEQRLYQVEMILEIEEELIIESLETALCRRLFHDLVFVPSGAPHLRIRRVQGLLQVKRAHDTLNQAIQNNEAPLVKFAPVNDIGTVRESTPVGRPRELRIELPSSVRTALRQSVMIPAADKGPDDWGYSMRISDTKDRFLRVLFYRSPEPLLHATIEYQDRIGALSSVTKALADDGFLILTSLHRPSSTSGRSYLEVLLKAPSYYGQPKDDIKRELERCLARSDISRELRITVGYPARYGTPFDRHRIAHSPEFRKIEQAPIPVQRRSFDQAKDRQELLTIQRTRGLSVSERHQLDLINRMSGKDLPIDPMPVLFISCRFSARELQAVRDIAEKEFKLEVLTAQDIPDPKPLSTAVIGVLKTCTHFLGVWTVDAKHGKKPTVSSWLLWELGAAEALGLKWHLLVHEDVPEDAWKGIHGSDAHVRFSAIDFEKKARIAVNSLRQVDRV